MKRGRPVGARAVGDIKRMPDDRWEATLKFTQPDKPNNTYVATFDTSMAAEDWVVEGTAEWDWYGEGKG